MDPNTLDDPMLVRGLMANARRLGREDLVLKCQMRIAELAGRDYNDVLEREFWIAVAAAEEYATQKNGKTTKLSRTRQKEKRVGIKQCLLDWALDPGDTDGFKFLIAAKQPELTGEAIVLRHADKFPQNAVTMARAKLEQHGVDPETLAVRP